MAKGQGGDGLSPQEQQNREAQEAYESFEKQISRVENYQDVLSNIYDIAENEKLSIAQKQALLKSVLPNNIKIGKDQAKDFKERLEDYTTLDLPEEAAKSEKLKKELPDLSSSMVQVIEAVKDRSEVKEQEVSVSPPAAAVAVESPGRPINLLNRPRDPAAQAAGVPPVPPISPDLKTPPTPSQRPSGAPPPPPEASSLSEAPPPSVGPAQVMKPGSAPPPADAARVRPSSVPLPPDAARASVPPLVGVAPPAVPPSSVQPKPVVGKVQDMILAGEEQSVAGRSQSVGKDEDPIVKRLREEVLLKQANFAVNFIEDEKTQKQLLNANVEQLSVLLAKKEVRDAIEKGANSGDDLAKKEWQELKNQETKAYAGIVNKENGFQSVADCTKGATANQIDDKTVVTTKQIQKNGIELDLPEKTMTTKGQLSIEGTEIVSCRATDFPMETKNGKGPITIAMALQDKKGDNISVDKPLYFTASYGEDGKLKEVSTWQLIQFAGDGPDAVGYTKVNGEIYTLGVTKGKYEEMIKEIAKNRGMEAELDKGKTQDVIGVDPNLKQEGKVVQKDQPDNALVPPPAPPAPGLGNVKKIPEVVDNSEKSGKNQLQGQAGKNQDPAQKVEIPESVNVRRAIQLFNDAQKGSSPPKGNGKLPPGGPKPNGPVKVPGGQKGGNSGMKL